MVISLGVLVMGLSVDAWMVNRFQSQEFYPDWRPTPPSTTEEELELKNPFAGAFRPGAIRPEPTAAMKSERLWKALRLGGIGVFASAIAAAVPWAAFYLIRWIVRGFSN